MTEGTSQATFIVVAIVIFGIFVSMSYVVFGDTLQPALVGMVDSVFTKKPDKDNGSFDKDSDYNVDGVVPSEETDFVFNGVDTIIAYKGSSKDIVIPKTIDGKEVTTINGSAFNNKNLNKVIMPNSLTTIMDGTVEIDGEVKDVTGGFAHNSIKEISLSANLSYIGSYAFFSGNLDAVLLPDGLEEIGGSAFENNNLPSISIPKTVTVINDNAFKNNNIKDVVYEKGSTDVVVGDGAFSGNNVSKLVIPDGTDKISDGAYKDSGLKQVVIPEGVLEIGDDAFSGNNLTNVKVPDSVKVIGDNAFKDNALTNIDLPNGITDIGSYAFYKNRLPVVNLPQELLRMGKYAFYQNKLVDVELPPKLQVVREWTFAYNQMPKKPIIPTNIAREESFAFYGNLYKDVDTVTEGDFVFDRLTNTITKYVGTSPNVFIPDTITDLPVEHIGRGSFNNSIKTKLQAVVIPDSVKTIDYGAFQKQSTLTSVTFGNYIEKIDSYAFQETAISEVILPNSLKTIGTEAFSETEYTRRNAIKKLDLGNSVETIGAYAFKYAGISELEIPISVKTMGKDSFAYISTLKKVYVTSASNSPLPKDPHSGASRVFSSRPEIIYGQPYIFNSETKSITGYLGTQKNIVIPNKIDGVVVEKIGDNAFDRLQGTHSVNIFVDLTSVKLSNNIKTIGRQAFAGNNQLTNLDLGYSVVDIGDSSFEQTALSEVNIPNSVVTIRSNAFKDKESFPKKLLKKVTFGNSVETIGSHAFGYTGIEELVIPKSVKRIDSFSFGYVSALKKVTIQNSKENIKLDSYAFRGTPSGLIPVYTE